MNTKNNYKTIHKQKFKKCMFYIDNVFYTVTIKKCNKEIESLCKREENTSTSVNNKLDLIKEFELIKVILSKK